MCRPEGPLDRLLTYQGGSLPEKGLRLLLHSLSTFTARGVSPQDALKERLNEETGEVY